MTHAQSERDEHGIEHFHQSESTGTVDPGHRNPELRSQKLWQHKE